MKIKLEFESIQDFFEELPKFAKAVNFSGQFVTVNDGKLEDPDLPPVEKTTNGVKVHTEGNAAAKAKIEAAMDANDAIDNKPKAETPKADAPKIDISEVRAAMAKLVKGGKREKAREILDAYGAENVTKLNEYSYAEVLAKIEEALNDG